MLKHQLGVLALLVITAGAPASVSGQAGPDSAERMAAQREAMARLAFMDGTWTGSASIVSGSGDVHTITQTERVGSLLGGVIKFIEGRGIEADGTLSFNAFAVISYDVDQGVYTMRSYAHGRAGDYPFTPNEDGFVWEIPAGETTIRFTAEFEDGRWREVGDRIMPDGKSIRFIEMDLAREGDTNWPVE